MPLLWMSIRDVSRITSGALHLDFNPIGSGQFEVPLDNWPGKVVHFFEHVSFAIVKVSLPMPRRVSTGACSAKHEELIWQRWQYRALEQAPSLVLQWPGKESQL
jgi:hypothetical protein